jgi:adenylyltransferase/sulfurtransferase
MTQAAGETIRLAPELAAEGRFHRQQQIAWWDQELLARARVLVIGAGALGNEILKNLALVGVGSVVVADMDQIEHSNLSRSVLFRESDIGGNKAEVAAQRAAEIYPAMQVQPFVGNIVYDLGAGLFHWADITIGGLDNREARVAVNRACLRLGRPWIDGAIERLDGVVRLFQPGTGACYECTMSDTDWQMLEARRSCALLNREEMEAGHTPTTATPSSIVAGFQCQEMLKYLHGQPMAAGVGLVINGQTLDVYTVTYPYKEDCLAHETFTQIVELDCGARDISIGDLIDRARQDLGPSTTLELSREILYELECPACGQRETAFVSLGRVTEQQAVCPQCRGPRAPILLHRIDGTESFLDRSPYQIGLPPFDIIVARSGLDTIAYLLSGDAATVLGAANAGGSQC